MNNATAGAEMSEQQEAYLKLEMLALTFVWSLNLPLVPEVISAAQLLAWVAAQDTTPDTSSSNPTPCTEGTLYESSKFPAATPNLEMPPDGAFKDPPGNTVFDTDSDAYKTWRDQHSGVPQAIEEALKSAYRI